jgi:hypothetical protein
MITKLQALQNLLPDVQVVMIEDEISQWLDDRPQPTDEAIATEQARLQADYDANQYQRDRVYPQLGEQFDKLWHDINNGTLDNTGAFFTALKEVKDNNPKPGE